MYRLKSFFLINILVLSISNLAFGQLSDVATDSGTYRGYISPVDGRVTVFQGIGYAAPPVGDLRWKAPSPAIPFAGVREADRASAACWQARNSDASVYALSLIHI